MFYTKGVDICNTKSMWNFLKNHYTYYTMNSCNRQESFAHNVKLYNLNLEGDWTVAMRYLFDNTDSGLLQLAIEDEIREFEARNDCYSVYFNGRSGGYLVLYDVALRGTVIPKCVSEFETYEEFKEEVKAGWYYWNVSDFNRELRDTVAIVREFDKLCDRLRDIVNDFSLRSFDRDKLEASLMRFESEYGNDLDALDIMPPELDDDKVRLNDIVAYKAFMHCFLECFGEDQKRVTCNDTHLWLKET